MKSSNPLLSPIVAAIFVGLVAAACEKPASIKESGAQAFPETALPLPEEGPYSIDSLIHDTRGRPLDGTIVGRTADKLYVTRKADGWNVEVPLTSLAEADRAFAEKLPVQPPPADFQVGRKSGAASASPGPSGDPPYLKARLEAIRKLEKENEILKIEADSTGNSMIQRARETQIAKNKRELVKLRAAIERYRAEHP